MTPSRSIQALMRMVLGAAVVLGVGGSAAVATALAAGAGSLKGPPEAGHDFTVAGLPLTYPSANVAAVVILGLAGIGFIALVQAGRSACRLGGRRSRPGRHAAEAAGGHRVLGAVLAHEEHHRTRRDPLRILVITCLADALFFLPAVARLRDRYVALVELRADD